MFVYGCKRHTMEGGEQKECTNLDASDTELHQCSEHLSASDFICSAANGNFDEKTVIVGLVPPVSIMTVA